MAPGTALLLAFLGFVVFVLAARWHDAFGILAVSSILTSLYYGFVWLLERRATASFQDIHGNHGHDPSSYHPRGWHSIVLEFEHWVLFAIWGAGVILFLAKFISDLGKP